jgi:deazaflavin-dependent oxidoreductase (nitroreductase family)
LWRVGNRFEAAQLRRFGISGMTVLRRTNVLVIETTGRRTGRRRSTPVAYWMWDDGNYYVGGGAAGMTTVPDWVANLRANPAAAVIVKRRRVTVHAEELTGDAYDKARSHAVELWPVVPKYERMSGRRVPYFRLCPANGPAAESTEPGHQTATE